MSEPELRQPALVEALVTAGRWPATPELASHQHTEVLATVERIAAVAPGQDSLYLYPPPFESVADSVATHATNGWPFWDEFGAIDELDPDRAQIIGDFGIGSDTPILLDHRNSPEPSVLCLHWPGGDDPTSRARTTWVEIAPTFDDFARRLGLI